MKLWMVKTITNLTVETNYLFKKKKNNCWFESNIRFIYAKDKQTAKEKYKNLFYDAADFYCEVKRDKSILKDIQIYVDDWSDDMIFDLAFNQSILDINDNIVVDDNYLYNIDFVKMRTTAEDFKNWWHSNCDKIINDDIMVYDPDWEFK